jgi:YidC/Oxa1 family membrane protein insertase
MQGMWGRYALFVVLSIGLLVANAYLMSWLSPPKPPAPEKPPLAQAPKAPGKAGEPAVGKTAPVELGKKEAAKPADAKPEPAGKEAAKPAPVAPKPAVAEVKVPDRWLTLGSLNPDGDYRMLVTLTSRGAAVQRIELSSPRFHELEDRSGYLGHVVADEAVRGNGCPVQVVGHGTPAQQAGLALDDVIKAVDDEPVTGFVSLTAALRRTKPGQTVRLKVVRNGKEMDQPVPVTLSWRPLEVIRPESGAPPSYLVAFSQIDGKAAVPDAAANAPDAAAPAKAAAPNAGADLDRELEGANLRTANWEVVAHDQSQVKFRRLLPQWDLEVFKTFRLVRVDPADVKRPDAQDYHLDFDLEIRNTGKGDRKVAYYVDGPNGLPTEGWWYANKVSRTWSAVGLRDVIVSFAGDVHAVSAIQIAGGDTQPRQRAGNEPMSYVGVDAQYFASFLIPKRPDPTEVWFSQWQPLQYGDVPPDQTSLANASFRVTSTVRDLKAGGAMEEKFLIFAGPKRPALLAQYGLGDIITYGWFGPVAKLLLGILHTFYSLIPNYGVAIILLTVLVRSCMFPLSKKQALNAQKMQELQPEIKKIQEKYKNNLEARGKAQQELFRKHNYNPMGGCLILFLQLPIFVGLYRALMVDVELRQAPLISESIRWASNLAAPDMLFDWHNFMPAFVARGVGMFGLGPYFNLLPLLTIVLFIWQQKKFMPPPTDEQQAMQQRVMQFMMIFMGILFFKVASGLCIYFIASSLWSIAERQFLPKTAAAGGSGPAASTAPLRPSPARDGTPAAKRKTRGRRN